MTDQAIEFPTPANDEPLLSPEEELWCDCHNEQMSIIQRAVKLGSPDAAANMLAGHAAVLLVEHGLDPQDFVDRLSIELSLHPGTIDGKGSGP